MVVNERKLAEVVAEAVQGQTPGVREELLPRIRDGQVVVYAPEGSEWATVVVADMPLCRVHWTRLVGAPEPAAN